MNYYTPNNFYGNSNYSGNTQLNYPQQMTMSQQAPIYQAPQQQNMMLQQQQVPQMLGLNGKLVDSADMVKATEVPIGGYGIFPKADLSEIYIKSWNNNGTTSITTFKPFTPPDPEQQQASMQSSILDRIGVLEEKIDTMVAAMKPLSIPQTKEKEVTRKEVNLNAY